MSVPLDGILLPALELLERLLRLVRPVDLRARQHHLHTKTHNITYTTIRHLWPM